MNRWTRSGWLAAMAAVAAVRPARSADLEPLQLAAAPQDDVAPVLYGVASGLFARLGLDVKLQATNSGAAAAAAVLGGSYQIAKSGTMALVSGHARGVPFAIIASAAISTTERPMCGLIVRRNSPIATGKDCNGKIFTGASLQDLNQLGAMAWIDATGGDAKSVRFVEVTSSAAIPAVEQGRVDGATVLNPVLQVALRSETVRVVANPFDAVAHRFASSVWFTTHDVLAKRPDVVRRFVAGYGEAARYETEHPAEMARYLAPFVNQDAELLAKWPRTTVAPTIAPSEVQPVIDLAVRYGVISKGFSAAELIAR